MSVKMDTKDICSVISDLEDLTIKLYYELHKKAKDSSAKKVFFKLFKDESELKEYYSCIFSKLPDEKNQSLTFEAKLPDYDNLFKGIKASWWMTKEKSLEVSEHIQMRIMWYLTKLKDSFPNLADDILAEVISEEQRQLEYLFDTHYLNIVNNILI